MRYIVASLTVALVAACNASSSYRGEGTFSDKGPGAANERYAVDLGPVDLSRPGHLSFRLAGLPPVEFTLGLRPVHVSNGCDATALKALVVHVHLQGPDGAAVIDEQSQLGSWTASSDLLYRRGTERQVPEADGAVKLVREGVRSSGGWGTYFTPKRAATYVVSFDVIDAPGTSGCESRLVLLGGGWK